MTRVFWADVFVAACTLALLVAWGAAIAAVTVCAYLVGGPIGAGIGGFVCVLATVWAHEWWLFDHQGLGR
jgi:hypothetical protein